MNKPYLIINNPVNRYSLYYIGNVWCKLKVDISPPTPSKLRTIHYYLLTKISIFAQGI